MVSTRKSLIFPSSFERGSTVRTDYIGGSVSFLIRANRVRAGSAPAGPRAWLKGVLLKRRCGIENLRRASVPVITPFKYAWYAAGSNVAALVTFVSSAPDNFALSLLETSRAISLCSETRSA